MERPGLFADHRYLGDKRTQRVHDLDDTDDEATIADIVATGSGICFGPDTLAEARNRGYRPATG